MSGDARSRGGTGRRGATPGGGGAAGGGGGTPGGPGGARPGADPRVLSPRAPEPLGPYPHARRVGDLLFLSGIGPRVRDEREIPGVVLDDDGRVVSYDIEAQCRSAIENVRYVLEDAGSSLERVVDVTVFLTDLRHDFEAYNRVYAEYFGEVRPARTTVGVEALPGQIAVELKVVALA